MQADPPEQEPSLRDVELTPPRVSDGAAIWQLVRETGVLDVNSPYLYLLIGAHFCETSVVARRADELLGVITGYLPPRAMAAPRAADDVRPDARFDVLFVWQVGVAEGARGLGLASAMLDALLARPACAGVRWVETTVSPGNRASRAMFESLARRLGTECVESSGFAPRLFPEGAGAHDEERLLRIGPFAAPTATVAGAPAAVPGATPGVTPGVTMGRDATGAAPRAAATRPAPQTSGAARPTEGRQ